MRYNGKRPWTMTGERLETRRLLAAIDIWEGAQGSNPNILGTLGRTIVADVRHPDCTNVRCLAAIDAIDHSVTILGQHRILTTESYLEETGYFVLDTHGGIVQTDGSLEGTRTIAGDTGTLFKAGNKAYWSATKHISGSIQIDVWSTAGIISSFATTPGECTNDGCDFTKLIGVANGEAYFQQSKDGTMYVYRDNELLLSQVHYDAPYSPLYVIHQVENTVVLEFQTPLTRGLVDEQGGPIALDVLDLVYSNDGNVLWYVEDDHEAVQYQPSVGHLGIVNLASAIASYNVQHPLEPPFEIELPNRLAYDLEYGYAVLDYMTPETGKEIEIWSATIGDSNLDNIFDSTDLVLTFQAGLYETEQQATWATGDWDRDGYCTTADLVLAFQMGTYQ